MSYNPAAHNPQGPILQDQDRHSFDGFMLSLGIVIGTVVGLVFIASIGAIDTQGRIAPQDPEVQAEVDARIRPVGHVVLLGSDELAAAAAAAMPAPVQTPLSGPQVYNEACYLCHSAPGVGGAPVIGDSAAWVGRVEQGMQMLSEHAINGFQGNTGFMPAKGGRVDLSDDEVVLAIEYMLEQLEP